MIMIYYWNQRLKKELHGLEADILTILKNINLMPLASIMYFLQDVFQMTAIMLVSGISN